MKIIFMGTPSFSCPTLEKLINDKDFEVLAVYTREPQISGRGHKITNSAVHNLALKHNIKVITPRSLKSPEVQKEFSDFQADVAVVVAYGLILPEPILTGTKLGCVNIHPSLLPRWRGAAPIQHTLMAGDQKSGITIIKMDKGLDSGDMICQEKIILNKKENYGNLSEFFSQTGAEVLIKTLRSIRDKKFNLTKQDDNLSTYAHKIKKEECEINWNSSVIEIDQKVRGLNGSIAAYFYYNEEKIKVFAIETSEENHKPDNLGKIIDKAFWIGCKDGAIRPILLQRPGKKAVSINDFLLGFKPQPGDSVRIT